MFYLNWTIQYLNTRRKVEQLNYAINCLKTSVLIYFLILLKSTSLREAFKSMVSICPCQFKFEPKMTPKYLEKSFTGRNDSDIFKTGLLALVRRWLVPNTITFVLEQLTIRQYAVRVWYVLGIHLSSGIFFYRQSCLMIMKPFTAIYIAAE